MSDPILLPRIITLAAGLVLFFIALSLAGFYGAIRPGKIISNITPQSLGLAYENIEAAGVGKGNNFIIGRVDNEDRNGKLHGCLGRRYVLDIYA